uniref:signal recognition particle receptor subunit alpha n=1 Tax=Oceanithermus sp. TaxID=2268145 RepID=UPI0025ED489C
MFENLSKRLQQTLDGLRGRGRISESDLKKVMREIRMSLLEADVNFEVAKAFTKRVQDKALGQKVYESLTPA